MVGRFCPLLAGKSGLFLRRKTLLRASEVAPYVILKTHTTMVIPSENGHRRVNGKRTGLVVVGVVLAVVVLAAFVSLHHSQVTIRVGTADRQTITASIATNG